MFLLILAFFFVSEDVSLLKLWNSSLKENDLHQSTTMNS